MKGGIWERKRSWGKSEIKELFVCILFLIVINANSQSTYYVAPDGNDKGEGTISDPWKTWGHAFNSELVDPGDTVYFRGGVYYKDVSVEEEYFRGRGFGYKIDREGTKDNLVHYWAYPGEIPILDCDRVTPVDNAHYGINAANTDYCHFKGLTVRNVWSVEGGYNGKSVEAIGWKNYQGKGNIYENCKVYNVHGIGFDNDQGNQVYYINCDAYDCCDSFAILPQLTGNRGSGFSTNNLVSHTDSVFYQNCRAWLCGDQGFTMRSEAYVEHNGCWSFLNGMLQGGGHGFKLTLNRETDSRVRRKLTHCLAVYNRQSGITTNDNAAVGMQLYNNVAFHNGYYPYWGDGFQGGQFQAGFMIYNTTSSDEQELTRIFRNNVSLDNEGGSEIIVKSDAVYTHSHNSWDSDISISNEDLILLDSATVIVYLLGERSEDGALPDLNGFLEPAANSDLIDAGIDLGLAYNGEAPDIGWRECKIQPGTNNLYPTIEITSPPDGSNTPNAVSIITNATDSDGSISKVEFFDGSTKIGETSSFPWNFTWEDPLPGDHSIRATATDNQGAKAVSAIKTIHVQNNNPPSITLTSPINRSEYNAPASISIIAEAYDSDGSIGKVEFYNGSIKLGETSSAPWTFSWNNVPVGVYTLKALAIDNLGAQTFSSDLTVFVNNNLPSIAISSPSNNAEFIAPATISITTEADDSDGSIDLVEFFSGTEKIGESISAPWLYTWSDVPSGSYSLTAVVTDNAGASTISAQISINVINPIQNNNQAPVVSITDPSTGQDFTENEDIVIIADASDPNGEISMVEFYNGFIKIGEVSSKPWSFTWHNVPAGTYSLVAVATDNENAKSSSSSVSITVNNPLPDINQAPVVIITDPSTGQTFIENEDIVIIADASDPDGEISMVEFYNGFIKIGEVSSKPWSFTWHNVPAGTYSLVAVATDNEYAKSSSSSVSITVNNPIPDSYQAPVVYITDPSTGQAFYENEDVLINADASDFDGEISMVEFYSGAEKLGEKTSSPWSFTWNNVSSGTYTLLAVAIDNQNLATISSPVLINVIPQVIFDANSDLINTYPNPSNGQISIAILEPWQDEPHEIVFMTLEGKIIHMESTAPGVIIKEFNFSILSAGTYICKVSSPNTIVTKRIIIY